MANQYANRVRLGKCITCGTLLGPHNRGAKYQRRCNFCIREIEDHRNSGDETRGRPRLDGKPTGIKKKR